MSLRNRTAVITGATRGIGRGLAIGLAEQGAHVIITGRTQKGSRSLDSTALAIKQAGGTCETFVVDHSDDADVAAWFEQLQSSLSRSGRFLDIFVNNAYAAVPLIMRNLERPSWQRSVNKSSTTTSTATSTGTTLMMEENELLTPLCDETTPLRQNSNLDSQFFHEEHTNYFPNLENVYDVSDDIETVDKDKNNDDSNDNMDTEDGYNPAAYWDAVNGVGLRNNFVCTMRAVRIMAEHRNRGVVVNISSWGGLISLFDAAYSIGKAGVDRLSAELARDPSHGVRIFSLCPGFVGTESMLKRTLKEARRIDCQGGDYRTETLPLWNMETPLFVGRVLAAIMRDDSFLSQVNGKVVVAAEAADHFHIDDENGFRPLSSRSIRVSLLKAAPQLIDSPLRFFIPRTWHLPWWLVRAKFAAVQYWG